MGASEARAKLVADSQFGGGSTSWAPATWYVGLSKTAPNADGSGFTEPVGASYARVAVTNNATNWLAAITSNGAAVKSNGAKITFPNPTGEWGVMAYVGLFTASSGGTPQYSNPLDAAITVKAGNSPVEFDIGQLALSFS